MKYRCTECTLLRVEDPDEACEECAENIAKVTQERSKYKKRILYTAEAVEGKGGLIFRSHKGS